MSSPINYAVLHFGTVRWARDLAVELRAHWSSGVETAVVFAVMSIEALVTEEAMIAVLRGELTEDAFHAADRQQGTIARIQALLKATFNQALPLDGGVGQDLRHLVELRNGLVHFRLNEMSQGLRSSLRALSRRKLVQDADAQGWPLAWPNYVRPELADWVVATTSGVANLIADMNPSPGDAKAIRASFEV